MCYGIHEAARRRERAVQNTAVPPSIGQRLGAHWAALMRWLRPADRQAAAVRSASALDAKPVAATAQPSAQPVARATTAGRVDKVREREAETV